MQTIGNNKGMPFVKNLSSIVSSLTTLQELSYFVFPYHIKI
jgi:hypothetical protein